MRLIQNFIYSLFNPNNFQVAECLAILKSPFVFFFFVHFKCALSAVVNQLTHIMSLPVTVLGGLSANTVPGKEFRQSNGVVGLHVVLFVFILRGTGLLGSAGRCCCHLCLLGGLLHLQPLLLGELCLLLPCLYKHDET